MFIDFRARVGEGGREGEGEAGEREKERERERNINVRETLTGCLLYAP